ncbi:transporter substrate-binding domain-containing protein [Oceanibacterium hippocampi]|uniref:Cystine-binding periplasmic protein n=1 Tax=Oceanibacterium hippocampi TaxID=745714 RepID=A0A1Y5TP31_9PROT|nr:transporter substrate-binding domain-containing protein [Oceanibacterium hippocampi]SLN64939.1 Cystine-binding periplasmic protein precursor [Oceanibacterium hippocampi]
MKYSLSKFGAIAAAVVSLAVGGQAAVAKSTLHEVIDRGKVIVGVPVDSPPFGFIDENGEPAGFDIDLTKLLAKQLGVELEMVPMTSINRIPYLLTNKVDVQVNLFGATPERAKQVAFTSPYSGLIIGVYGPADVKVTSPEEVGDYRIAVGRGTTMDLTLSEMVPDDNIVRYEDEATTMAAVFTGQADMWAAVNMHVINANKKNADRKMELKFVMRRAPASIGLRQGDPDWMRWLETFVYYNKINGELQKLHRKWLDEDLQKDLPSF